MVHVVWTSPDTIRQGITPSPQKSETRASVDYTHFSMGYIPTKLVLDHHQRGMETGWTMNEQWRKHYEEKKKGGTPARQN